MQLFTHIYQLKLIPPTGSAVGIRTFKQRTAQKLGTTAANLYDFLVELAISD